MLGVNVCLSCRKNQTYPICIGCKKNPFKVEKCRQVLAAKKDSATLKRFYNTKLPEIRDLNTSSFWDKKLHVNESIDEQDGMTKDRIAAVISFLPRRKIKLLDIGAGHGFLEERLPHDIDIYANDFSEESVVHLKERFKGKFEIQSVYKLKYKPNFFEVICILEVLEHVPPSRIFFVLKSIHSLLKPKGILIVSVPMNEGLEKMKQNPNGHVRMYTPDLIKTELELSGFQLIETKTLYAFRNQYLFKKLIASFLKNRWQPNNIILKAFKK